TLSACCLVQKDWLPLARECLYGTMTFFPSSPDIAAYVRRINLDNRGSSISIVYWSVRRIAGRFRHVKELALLCLDFTAHGDQAFQYLTQLQEVEVLSVSDSIFQDSNHIMRFVSSFPALAAVALRSCALYDSSEAALPQPSMSFPINLRKGNFTSYPCMSVIRWFFDNARCVTSLCLPDLREHQFSEFASHLEKIGDDLQQVSLCLNNWSGGLLPLSYNTKLRSLVLQRINLPGRKDDQRCGFSWLTAWLQSVSLCHLTRISLCFIVFSRSELSQFPWADVDAILSTFPSLREVTLRFFASSWMLDRYVKDFLPLLRGKRVLVIDIGPEDDDDDWI
ncbi:hypothetical protein BDZ89DRAFT_1063699, partial [Hymenopellis radicata]